MHKKPSHTPHLPAPVPPQPVAPPNRLGALRRGLGMSGPLMRRPWGWPMKIGAVIVGVFLVLLVGVNLFISADWVQARVAARIKEQTGHDLAVNGSTRLLFMPGPHVVITDAKITDPDAQAGTADLEVAKLTLNLNLAELVSSQIVIERVVLVRPVLTVRVGGDAQPQLRRQGHKAPKKIRFAKAESGGLLGRRRELRLKDVRVKDGTVAIVYDDEDTGAPKRIENINVKLALPAVNGPVTGKGRFEWKDQKVGFSFELSTLADLRAQRPAQLLLALDTRAIAVRFTGTLATQPELSGQGHLSAKARSIPSVLAWMREKPTLANSIGDGELASDVSWTKTEIKFANARFALEHASGQGEAVISLNSPRPHVRAAFAFDHLDLNPFLDDADKKRRKKRNAPKVRADNPAPDVAPTKDWFTKPDVAVVETVGPPPMVAAPAGPSRRAPATNPQAVSLAPAASFDADVNLNIRKVRVGKIDIGPSSLGLLFRDGVMNATLGGMELYGGNASGKLIIDVTKPIPAFTGNVRLEGVEAKPLLNAAAQVSMISGRTKFALEVSGEGSDADEIKASLSGHGSVLVTDGSFEGIDITAFISGLGEGDFELRQGPDAKTAFSNLGGGFTIANGIVETNNLNMVSPLLEVTAEGSVDLTRSTLDILAHPEITKGPKGKSGANNLAGLSVPVRIEGPLEHPRIRPQIGSLLANPESASKAVNKIGAALQKKFKGKPLGETLGRFLGNVQIDGTRRGKPPPQAQAAPRSAEPDQDDEVMDPDLEEILR